MAYLIKSEDLSMMLKHGIKRKNRYDTDIFETKSAKYATHCSNSGKERA